MAVDDSGNVYVAGEVGTYPRIDYVTIKYNPAGETLWVATYDHGGASWDSIDTLVGGATSPAAPFIDVAGSILHVIWRDMRDGHGAIYYKRNPTGNVGVAETPNAKVQTPNTRPTIVRGVLFLDGDCPRTGTVPKAALLNIAGRKTADLRPGPNDVSRLTPGVYFVRQALNVERSASRVRKVVLAR